MRRLSVTLLVLSMSSALIAACQHDGRTLRPAGPDQTASVSTSSTSAPLTSDQLGDGEDNLDDPTTTVAALVTEESVGLDVEVQAPWVDGGLVPDDQTCDGANESPSVSWTDVPEGTVEIAITLIDVTTSTDRSVLWLVAGISPDTLGLEAGMIPLGAAETVNQAGAIGYDGPCPLAGNVSTVDLTVHFLDTATGISDGDPAAAALDVITESEILSISLHGSFSRP